MTKFALPMMALPLMIGAMLMPAAANAAQCRNTATGKFATCGSPGAVPTGQYVAKTKSASKTKMKMAATAPMPAAAPAKPGFMAMLKPKPKPTTAAMAMPTAMPMAKPSAKLGRCKSTTGKFVKCGTPGAKPV